MEGQKQYEETLVYRQGFISDSKPEPIFGGEEGQMANGYSWKETRLNYFCRVSYNYLECYLFEFVWRVSLVLTVFRKMNVTVSFLVYVGASGVRASEEGWWKENIRFIDYFKTKCGSVSQTGNDALVDSDGKL